MSFELLETLHPMCSNLDSTLGHSLDMSALRDGSYEAKSLHINPVSVVWEMARKTRSIVHTEIAIKTVRQRSSYIISNMER